MGIKILEKIFSLKNIGRHKVITFLGIKLKIKYNTEIKETHRAKKIQNRYDLKYAKQAETVVVFIEIEPYRMCGGQMSLFSLCQYSKDLLEPATPVIMTTMPGRCTYAHNDCFLNEIDICRWEQTIEILKNKKKVIIHLPEACVFNPETKKYFLETLTNNDFNVLYQIPDLQINILNQNIEVMPSTDIIKKMKRITENITQTVAHERYCSQEIANKYELPTHLFSGYYEIKNCSKKPFTEKQDLILFSPDLPPQGPDFKVKFIKKLINGFPGYEIKRIFDFSFEEYLELTRSAKAVITFGEGFDGYFNNSPKLGTICLAVYNDKFFPDEKWKDFKNTYETYEDMSNHIVDDLKKYFNNEEDYYEITDKHAKMVDELYSKGKTINKLEQFYNKDYDFYPKKKDGVI